MACWFEYKGKRYDPDELVGALKEMTPTEAAQYIPGITPVPNAPFKDTDAWAGLALKRMIRHAAENGYDRISWTPGEAQAARYDLSKQVAKVSYNPKQNYIKAWDHEGREVIAKEGVKPEQLPDIIGKEAAEKLINQKPKDFERINPVSKHTLRVTPSEHQYHVTNTIDGRAVNVGKGTVGSEEEAIEYAYNYLNKSAKEINQKRELEYGRLGPTHILSGQDLKVGGEGMREFYDKMLPKIAEKIGKAHGVKVKQDRIKTTDMPWSEYEKYPEDHPYVEKNAPKVHYFDIPPSLREQALKGMSMFQKGGRVIVGKPRSRGVALKIAYQAKRGRHG